MQWEVTTRSRGRLYAASMAKNGDSPIRVCWSATIPLVFHLDKPRAKYHLTGSAQRPAWDDDKGTFPRAHHRIFDFGPAKGFKREPLASWVSLGDESEGVPASALSSRFCTLTALSPEDGLAVDSPTPSPLPFPPLAAESLSTKSFIYQDDSTFSRTSCSWTTDDPRKLANMGSHTTSSFQGYLVHLWKGRSLIPCRRIVKG